MIKKIIEYLYFKVAYKKLPTQEDLIMLYKQNGNVPWSEGYIAYKEKFIEESLKSDDILSYFKSKKLPDNFASGIDDRSVEYPWIFTNLSNGSEKLLDAGSTFNFKHIVNQEILKEKELTIYTFYPEGNCFYNKRINYVYGDLRELCFKDEYFDTIVSQSTIEHIEMDNSIYGYSNNNLRLDKSYEYLKAIEEMYRVLKPSGKLLVTIPYGKFENHGFFQQFDEEMLNRILIYLKSKGKIDLTFFKYEKQGWKFADQAEVSNVISFNPHTGIGKGEDGAAHSRGIACLKFIKDFN